MADAFNENRDVWMVVRTITDGDMNTDDRKQMMIDSLSEEGAKEYVQIMTVDQTGLSYQNYEMHAYRPEQRKQYVRDNNIEF